MNQGKLVFAQLMRHLPLTTFRRCVARYRGELKVKSFSCLDQFLCMAFAQLTYRESLRDIEVCLRAQRPKLYHLGIRSAVARNTLANANAVRDWRIYADFAQRLIGIARLLYAQDPFGVDLQETVYALDTTTIDLCLSVFPWAPFRSAKAAIKLHTLLDLRGNIPTFIHISDGKMHEVNILDHLWPGPGAFYIMDRGFLDFERLYRFHEAGSFFVTRGKSNLKIQRRYSHPVDRKTGLICDQSVVLTGFYSHQGFEAPLRRIRFKDPETAKTLIHVRENPIGSTTCTNHQRPNSTRYRQPVDSVRVTLGHYCAHIRTHTGQFAAWRFRMKVREQRRETRDYDMKDTQRLRVRSNAL
jgi:hypothetical protein